MTAAKRNILFAVLIQTLYLTAMLCVNGTFLQTFLSSLGFSEKWLYIHSTLLQAGNIGCILFCSRWADKGKILNRTAGTLLAMGLIFLLYLPFCILQSNSARSFLLLLGVGVAQSAVLGLYVVCSYKLPYHLYDEKGYGTVLAWSAGISAVITFAAGALVSAISAKIAFPRLMLVAFILSAVFFAIAAILQKNMTILRQQDAASESKQNKQEIPLKKILLAPVFRNLFAANLMRGFTNGAITVLPVMALSMGYGKSVTTAMVSVQAIAMLFSGAAFGALNRRTHPRNTVLFGSFCCLVLLAMLLRNSFVFLAAYCIVIFGRLLVDNAVPASLLHAVPKDIAGPYHAWRMILHHAGTLLGTSAATVIPLPVMLILAAGFQLISGTIYSRSKVMHIRREEQEVFL